MDDLQRKHVKIINTVSNKNEIELLIKLLKSEIKDLDTSWKWKKILHKLQKIKMTYEHSISTAAQNEYSIIKKLYVQSTRPSPFQLTKEYARTANLWEQIKNGTYRSIQSDKTMSSNVDKSCYGTEIGSELYPEATSCIPDLDNTDVKDTYDSEITRIDDIHPLTVNVNETKENNASPSVPPPSLSYDKVENISKIKTDTENIIQNLEDFLNDDVLKPIPETLIFTDNDTRKKVFKIRILNTGTESKCVQFKDVSDATVFQYVQLCPMISTKIYPGLSAVFKLTIKLKRNVENISSGLCFRVVNNTNEKYYRTMFLPTVSDFVKKRCVIVSENVYIPPVYTWQLKSKYGFPKGVLKINVSDDFQYDVYFRKQTYNIDKFDMNNNELQDSSKEQLEIHDKSKVDNFVEESDENINISLNVISFILETAIQGALDIFVIRQTFLRVSPKSKRDVAIFFTKADFPGFYQSLYNIEFYDTETKELITTKHVKVYAELLRHPIQIEPVILDMSHSEITHGKCKDTFTLRNCHKLLTFIIKIETTDKMKKLFKVTPKEASVSAGSDVNFTISSCVAMDYTADSVKERAFFTIKINITSNDRNFRNISPIFYEVIMPCARELKTVYNMDVSISPRE